MNRSFRMSKSFIIFAILLPLMTIISIIIYTQYSKTKESVFEIIQEHLIHEKVQLFKNYSNYLTLKLGADLKNQIGNNDQICGQYEEELQLRSAQDL